MVGSDPERPCPAEAFQVPAAACVCAIGDHLAVHQVDWVEGLAPGGRDPGPGGGENGAPGCLEWDSGAGIPEEPNEILAHGGGGDPHERAPRCRPEAGRGEEGEEDVECAAVLEHWLDPVGAEAAE